MLLYKKANQKTLVDNTITLKIQFKRILISSNRSAELSPVAD